MIARPPSTLKLGSSKLSCVGVRYPPCRVHFNSMMINTDARETLRPRGDAECVHARLEREYKFSLDYEKMATGNLICTRCGSSFQPVTAAIPVFRRDLVLNG